MAITLHYIQDWKMFSRTICCATDSDDYVANLTMLTSVYRVHQEIHNYLTSQLEKTSPGSKLEKEAELNLAMAEQLFSFSGLELYEALIQFLNIIKAWTDAMQVTNRPAVFLGGLICNSLPTITKSLREDNPAKWSNATIKSMLPLLEKFDTAFRKKFVTVIHDIHWFGYFLHPMLKNKVGKMSKFSQSNHREYLKQVYNSLYSAGPSDVNPIPSVDPVETDEDLELSFGDLSIDAESFHLENTADQVILDLCWQSRMRFLHIQI
jgi:hypothetical protein